MTRKDYEQIALVFQAECPDANWNPNKRVQWELLRTGMAKMLARDNSAFKFDRFIRACEPGANVRART